MNQKPKPKNKIKIPFWQRRQGSKRSPRRWTTMPFWKLCHQGPPSPTWGFDWHPSRKHGIDEVPCGLGCWFCLGLSKLGFSQVHHSKRSWLGFLSRFVEVEVEIGLLISLFLCFFIFGSLCLFLRVFVFGSLCLFLYVFVARFVEKCCALGNSSSTGTIFLLSSANAWNSSL